MGENARDTEKKPAAEEKSRAKAAGLKSTFIMADGELLMTGFGRGNDAVVEKRVRKDGRVETLAKPPAFSAAPLDGEESLRFRINGRGIAAVADNPLHANPDNKADRDGLIHARGPLEKRYYGRNFADNIHIQAIHNMLDVEKILALHINNIVYELNNLLRNEGEDVDDFVGYLRGDVTYEAFMEKTDARAVEQKRLFRKLCDAPQLRYFGLEIGSGTPDGGKKEKDRKNKKKDPDAVRLTESDFYYLLCLFANIRNKLAHGQHFEALYSMGGAPTDEMLGALMSHFNPGRAPKAKPAQKKQAARGIAEILDSLYARRVRDLNDGFLELAATNLRLLFTAFGVNDVRGKEAYVRDYYDFVVRKTYKNQGFSVKKLRERMLTDNAEAAALKDERYDSVRGKLYPFIDFAIFTYFRRRPEKTAGLVNDLRASLTEEKKEGVYGREAENLRNDIKDQVMNHILPEMDGQKIAGVIREGADRDVNRGMLRGIMIPEDAFFFCEAVYAMTLFLDGKEINDLLTSLVSKFESIAAFRDVMQKEKLPADTVDGYAVFNVCRPAAEQLRLINNFARMSRESPSAKEVMYREAVEVLGYRMTEAEMQGFIESMLDPEKSPKGSQGKGVRNFIANNVLESDRFRYIVRYGNVKKLRALAENGQVVSFVLKDIPEAQITRYYNACTGKKDEFREDMRQALTEIIRGLSFSDLRDVRQNSNGASLMEQEDKRRKQSAVRLYLTVLYLIIKNLVYINARYFLAFHCLERDRMLIDPKKWKSVPEQKQFAPEYGFAAFAAEQLRQYPPKNRRVAAYLEQNFANSDAWPIRAFRNKVEHLDAVRNADLYINDIAGFASWFELYHYVLQRRLMAQFDFDLGRTGKDKKPIITEEGLNPKTAAYFGRVRKYRTYCKDFVKALNVPFAYNLPRYKNLTVDALFDRNRLRKTDGAGTLAAETEDTQD